MVYEFLAEQPDEIEAESAFNLIAPQSARHSVGCHSAVHRRVIGHDPTDVPLGLMLAYVTTVHPESGHAEIRPTKRTKHCAGEHRRLHGSGVGRNQKIVGETC